MGEALTMDATDEFSWWREAIKGNHGPVSADNPQCGYFKIRQRKDGPWSPVAIFHNADGLVCRVGNEKRDPLDVWTYAANSPIAKDIAKTAFETGRFPDEPEPLEQRSNMPSDPFEAMKVEIEDRAAQAEQWLKDRPEIKSQQDCDLARNMQAQLIKLGKQADADRDAEKRPHMEAANAVQAKFAPLLDVARTWAVHLRTAYEAFMKAEERRLKAEADARYKAERAAAEAARKAVEEQQAKKMAEDPVAALTEAPPELPELPKAPEPVKVAAGGGVGRKAGLKSVWIPEITDFSACLAHYAQHPDVRKIVEKIVAAEARLHKQSTNVPGVVMREERKAA